MTATKPSGKLPTCVQIERRCLDYLSDQWPSAYAELVRRSNHEMPTEGPERGYEWMPEHLLVYLADQWPTAHQMMLSMATKEPAILASKHSQGDQSA